MAWYLLRPIKSAAESVCGWADRLCAGTARTTAIPLTLVILESTTYPGTTDEEIRPILEAGGIQAGNDFWLVFSPERIDSGNQSFGPKNTPKR
jgi:UDP-N-acetyl-D-glucosamine dehydrogenase